MKNEAFSSSEVPRTGYKYHINDIPNIANKKELIFISESGNKYSFGLLFSTLDSGEFIAYIQKLDVGAKGVTQAGASENLIPKLTQYIETFESKEIKFLYESIIESEVKIDSEKFKIINNTSDHNRKEVIFTSDKGNTYYFDVNFHTEKAKGGRSLHTAKTKDDIFIGKSYSKLGAIEDMFENGINSHINVLEKPKIQFIKNSLLKDDSERLVHKIIDKNSNGLMSFLIQSQLILSNDETINILDDNSEEPGENISSNLEFSKTKANKNQSSTQEKNNTKNEGLFLKENMGKFETNYFIIENGKKVFLCEGKISFDHVKECMSIGTSRGRIGNHTFLKRIPYGSLHKGYGDVFDGLIKSIAKKEKTIEQAIQEMKNFIKKSSNEEENNGNLEGAEYSLIKDSDNQYLLRIQHGTFHLNITNIRITERKGKYSIYIEYISEDNKSNNLIKKHFSFQDRDKKKVMHKLIRQIKKTMNSEASNKKIYKDFLESFKI